MASLTKELSNEQNSDQVRSMAALIFKNLISNRSNVSYFLIFH